MVRVRGGKGRGRGGSGSIGMGGEMLWESPISLDAHKCAHRAM